MKNKTLEFLLDNSFPNNILMKFKYRGRMLKNIRLINYKQMINMIKTSKNYELFKDIMNNLDESILYKSDIHGIGHNIRVALMIYAISILENMNIEDIKILLDGALYHDLGRINDAEDSLHGKRSAEIIENLELDLTKEEKEILQIICTYHSVNDNKIDIDSIENIDHKRVKKLLSILKDADALDRVRVDDLDISYLRNKSSLSLVPATFELYNNYGKAKKYQDSISKKRF